MGKYVFIFSFSPVQEFIAEARRLGDLFAGSGLLSDMAEAAVKTIKELPGKPDIVYPIPPAAGDKVNLPNKITAIIPTEADDIEVVAEKLMEAVNGSLQGNAEQALREFEKKAGGKLKPDDDFRRIWREQLNGLFEFYWAAAPIGDDNYIDAYKKASRAFDAAKRTRAFKQMEQSGRKDTLSGRRAALHVQGVDQPEYWERLSRRLGGIVVKKGEMLDAFGLIKRFGFDGASEGMTIADVSAARFLSLANERAHDVLNRYENLVKGGGRFTYDLLYMDEIDNKRKLREDYGLSEEWIGAHHAEMRNLLRRLYKAVGFEPSNYYAIMYMDGDSMGSHIQDCRSLECHRNIGQKMREFAGKARESVRRESGFDVYIGGDDVMALAPLRKIIPLAQSLSDKFREIFAEIGDFTVSAGVAVVHRTYPLSRALKSARAAERMAKDVDGKNALGMYVIKRSGGIARFISKWDIDDGWHRLGDAFGAMEGYIRRSELSGKFAYEVTDFAQRMFPRSSDGKKPFMHGAPLEITEPFTAELGRLISRHKSKDSGIDPAGLASNLTGWAEVMYGGDETPPIGLWLQFARFVALEEREESRGGGKEEA